MTIEEARTLTLANGGGTFEASSLEPVTSGPWAVGGAKGISTLVVRPDSLPAFVDACYAVLKTGAPFLGTWVDGGVIHVDAVDLVEDRQTAFDLAFERGEASIYHLTDNELVWVHGQDPAYSHLLTEAP
jgi:hypothetical protein